MNFFLSFVFMLLFSAQANEGVIIVYKAPMFGTPSLEAPVVQWLKKGELINIHQWHFQDFKKISTNNREFQALNDWQKSKAIEENLKSTDVLVRAENVVHDEKYLIYGRVKTEDPYAEEKKKFLRVKKSDFYLTMDKMGRNAYVPKEYVKVIYNDPRENTEKINPFSYDPTDYRLKGSIPETYPYDIKNEMRFTFQLGMGTNTKSFYPYPNESNVADKSLSPTVSLSILKQATAKEKDYFFYGGAIELSSHSTELQGENITIEEKETNWSLGPKVDFHIAKGEKWSLWLNSQVLFSFSNFQISQLYSEQTQTKSYQAWRIKPVFEAAFSRNNFYKSYDLLLSVRAELNLPATYSSESEVDSAQLWLSENAEEFQTSLSITPTFMLGIAKAF